MPTRNWQDKFYYIKPYLQLEIVCPAHISRGANEAIAVASFDRDSGGLPEGSPFAFLQAIQLPLL